MSKDITVTAKNEGKDFDPISAGLHIARCYSIFDIGTQKKEWQGETKWIPQIILTWEIPDERIELERDGKKVDLPRAISKFYTKSIGDKANLRKDLVNWRGRDFTREELEAFSLRAILGKSCQMNIIHKDKNGKTYANIGGIMPLGKGMKHEEPENPVVMWSVGDPVDGVPEWVINIAKQSKEWAMVTEDAPEEPEETEEEDSDSVPF